MQPRSQYRCVRAAANGGIARRLRQGCVRNLWAIIDGVVTIRSGRRASDRDAPVGHVSLHLYHGGAPQSCAACWSSILRGAISQCRDSAITPHCAHSASLKRAGPRDDSKASAEAPRLRSLLQSARRHSTCTRRVASGSECGDACVERHVQPPLPGRAWLRAAQNGGRA